MNFLRRLFFVIRVAFVLLSLALLSHQSELPSYDSTEKVRFFTRDQEFDYLEWTLDAFWVKFSQAAMGIDRYRTDAQNAETVLAFIDMARRIQQSEGELQSILADPAIKDKVSASEDVHARLTADYALREKLGPLAESILQNQFEAVLRSEHLTVGGQAIPSVLYHITSAPMALIVSPRDVIAQAHNISIQPDMTIDEQVALEDAVARGLDRSTLMVPIGGVGLYPSMVTQTSNINWLAEVIAHEWSHLYFSLRPLGMSYLKTPALRTMNETSAKLIGRELGAILIEQYYPDFVPSPPPEPPTDPPDENVEPPAPVFDHREALRETRIQADRMLSEGRIEQAEQYMELRRRYLWDNGYRLRKLNQAFFAFYGAYADVPGGAAGNDPVADAVRTLWDQRESVLDFMSTIGWMTMPEQLFSAVRP